MCTFPSLLNRAQLCSVLLKAVFIFYIDSVSSLSEVSMDWCWGEGLVLHAFRIQNAISHGLIHYCVIYNNRENSKLNSLHYCNIVPRALI